MIPCPVCQKTRINTNQYACANCLQLYRSACLFLATHLSDLYKIATKQSSLTRQSQRASADYSPIPLRIKAWETYNEILAHTDSVIAWNNITVANKDDYTVKLLILRNIDIFHSNTYAIDMRGFILLARQMNTMLTPIEEKTYIGQCPQCHNSLWGSTTQKQTTCNQCASAYTVSDVKASTLRSLYNSTYEATVAELVEWLKSWGIKTSKRTIQRWCTEGKIHAKNIDNRGTKLFMIGDVLKNIKVPGKK